MKKLKENEPRKNVDDFIWVRQACSCNARCNTWEGGGASGCVPLHWSFMQLLIQTYHSVQAHGLIILKFSLIYLETGFRQVHWSASSEMRGRVSVEALALVSTEVTKLCAQRAWEHVSSAHVQHTLTHTHNLQKEWEKNPKQLFQHCHCRVQAEAGGSSWQAQLACVSMTAAWAFSLRIEFSCPPEDDIRLAKI